MPFNFIEINFDVLTINNNNKDHNHSASTTTAAHPEIETHFSETPQLATTSSVNLCQTQHEFEQEKDKQEEDEEDDVNVDEIGSGEEKIFEMEECWPRLSLAIYNGKKAH